MFLKFLVSYIKVFNNPVFVSLKKNNYAAIFLVRVIKGAMKEEDIPSCGHTQQPNFSKNEINEQFFIYRET